MKLVVSAAIGLLLAGCPSAKENDSIRLSNDGAAAYGAKRYDVAVQRFSEATARWDQNHTAFYGLAAAYAAQKKWKEAAEACEKAVNLEPNVAMYNLMCGSYLYDKAIDTATKDQATKESKKPEDVEVDLRMINFESAKKYLETAIKLNGELWRAHYLLGSIHRHGDKPKQAAESFTKAVQLGANDPGPWIALAELYRLWDESERARKVAEEGTKVIPALNEQSELWFEVGMAHYDQRQYDKAIEAFDKALEGRKDNYKAKFARGQSYWHKGEYAKAKLDLEEFSKAASKSVEFYKQQASHMLMDIMMKTSPPSGGGGDDPAASGKPGQKMSPEDMVKQHKAAKPG